MRRALFLAATFALLAPSNAFAREEFDPTHEFELHDWVPIHLGPLDLSINKAVAYLMLGSVCTMALGILLMRVRLGVEPDTRQTIGEQIYELAQTQIAEVAAYTPQTGSSTPKNSCVSPVSGKGTKPSMLIVQMKRSSVAT